MQLDPPAPNGSQGQYILETSNLSKDFGGFAAVSGVDLQIRRGSIHALIGPNGAGKTTVFNLLTKFLAPSNGSIRYNGRDITQTAPADVARLGLVRSFQISAVFPHVTVLGNMQIALQRQLGVSFHFWRSGKVLSQLDDKALALIQAVGLSDVVDAPAVELSYGRKRALEIATTLALDPEMLLLDEPMAGLGREDIVRISNLIRQAGATRTVLMVEHNLNVVANLCDKVTVLARGKVLTQGSYDEVSRNPQVIEAYMGAGHDAC